TLKKEYSGLSLKVMISDVGVDYAVAMGAAYMAAIDYIQTNKYAELSKIYGLSEVEIGDVRLIEEKLGVIVLPRPGAVKRYMHHFTGCQYDIRKNIFLENKIVNENYFYRLRYNLESIGRQILWRIIRRNSSSKLNDVIRAVRRTNLVLAVEQIRQCIDTSKMCYYHDAALIAAYRKALDKLFARTLRDNGYFGRERLHSPRFNIEIYCALLPIPFSVFINIYDFMRRMYDDLFGLGYNIRMIEKLEEQLGLRQKDSHYRLRFFRRDGSSKRFWIHPYAGFITPEIKAVSLKTGIRALNDKILIQLKERPAKPVVVRIDGRPGNRKSHSISLLKEGLERHVSKDEIALIEVNDYKRPDLFLFDSDSFFRDYEALLSNNKYKVILVEGTIIELYVPSPLPLGDFSVYIESTEQRRMEYLLNGNDKERLEYFLRYHPYHNIIMRYRTDYMRLFADFIIDTYLIPEENITNVEELDSFQHLLYKSASEKYFIPDRIIQGLTNGGSAGKILNSQPLIAKALAWLSEKKLIGRQDGLRINIVTSNGFISGYDDNGFGLAESIFTNERLSVEEKNSLILLNLFLLFKNREITIKGLNREPIKYSIYREIAALYLLFNILLPILAKEQDSLYSLESFISGVEKIGGSNEQIEEFKRLNRICATACPAVVLEEIFSYLSRYQQNFNQSLYVVHLVNINMPATIRKVMQGLTTEAPIRSSYPFSVNNSEYEVFNPVKLKAIISDIRISTEVLDGNLTPVQFNNLQARLDLVHPYLAHAPPEKQELILCITPHTSQTAQGRIIAEYIEGGIGHPGVVQLHPIILNSNLGAEYLNNFFVAVLFDEIQSHHLLGYNQEKGDIHTLGFLGTQPVILESVSGNIDALANMGIIPDPVWGQEISAARAKALLEPNYFIKEFNGKAQEQGLRFTFATLSIGCNDIKEDLPETAKRFVSYMGKFMADNDKCPCFAISILGLPAGFSIDIGLLQDFLGSMVKATDNLGIPIVGGHTVENSDVIYTIIFVEIITASKFTTVVREENVTFTQTGKRAFNEDKLITTHRAQGCAAKYPPDKLDEILKHAITRLPLDNFGNMHIKDDVILYHLDAQRSIAFTVDIIKPIVNSSTLFSRIAIVHAASDLYAKGIFPAGSIGVMFAPTYIKPASLSNIIQGGKEETSRLASAYLGTYSVANRDLFYGALMYGICERGAYISNSTIQDGDWLILSKPLGAGVIAGYMIMKGLELSLEEIKIYENMLSHLVEPNDKACYAVRTAGVHASTDVTGFSLIGHLNEMLESTGLAAELWLNNIPFLSGAEQFYSEAFSCSVNRNMHYFSDLVEVARAVDGYANAGKIALLYDAQTSGGILISASSEQVLKIMEILDDNNVKGAVVGRIIPRLEKPISIVEKPNCCVPNMPFHPEVEHSIPPVGKKSSSPITGHSNFLICYSLMEINKPINQGGVKCTIYRFLNSPALSLQMKGFLSMLNTLAGSLAITFLSSRVAGLREKAVPETGLSSARRSALLSEERPYAVFLKERSPLANDAISIIKNNSFCSSSPVEITAERIARIEKALSGEYRGKKFPSGETYFTHTKRVASKVMEFTSEEEVVYAAYLHKVSSEKEIKRILKGLGVDKSKAGRIIAYIKRLTGLINLPYGLNYKDQEAVNNRINLVIKLSESIEGLYLVLADKFISISTYTGKKDLLEEIACIYAPLAERLGLDELAGDFLDEVFRNYAGSIHNIIEKEIETVIGRSRTDANKYLNDLSEDIRNGLNEDGIRATVLSRVKKAFTAWLKINRGDEKYTSISDLTDILGITVIVESDVDVHGAVWYIGKILKGRFGININASNIDSKDIKLEGGYVIPGQKYHIDFEDGFGVKYEIQIYSQKTYREMRLGKM
ncbi:MAG: selenide, water dikinase SelD, partial [Candidatus Omnitrophota bacterium]